MKAVTLLAACLLLVSCASSDDNSRATLLDPGVEIIQLLGPSSASGLVDGPFSIQYQIDISNHSGEDIALERVDLATIGVGAYSLGPQSQSVKLNVASGKTASTTFWMPAVARGGTASRTPVMLRVSARFTSAGGRFQKTFTQIIDQSTGRGQPSE